MTALPPAVLRQLRAAQPFAALPEAGVERLLAYASVEERPRGDVLFREGEPAESLYFVLEGSVGLAASVDTPERAIVEIFREGELFVAPAAILRQPYLVSGVVLAPARLVVIPGAVFRSLLEEDGALARGMLNVLARHWRVLVEQIKDLKLRSSGQRLAAYLVALAPQAGRGGAVEIDLREPRKALAARLNMAPENLSRALVELRAHGVSSAGRTALRIESTARLRAFAYGERRVRPS